MGQQDEVEYYPDFDPELMEDFVARDRLLHFVVEDLMKRGHPRMDALEVAFNTYVLDDSVMIDEYERGASRVDMKKN